ncbi:hydantoinase/oxoprolinase family protein [Natronorubrum tibetense]|uniref:5-oxoprolinase (ATP-hydrolyzing) n=1 Tax=Natronorubrum tibetense GA33 TaxID=1114856 RepID=L9VPK9_9EURY|nr:hydantoinase/oxoprolinase family protein [Natronorubrum tibetense]ELY38986.1 5-oxoprolinase (ATP-hydrolyzing) [Natronorubrum tibetense GA33]
MTRAGIDIGGTFTDLIVFDEETGTIEITKTPSTPENSAKGVINGLTKAETDIADLDFFSHGSTVGTNALIERELPRTGLITTAGFRDVHEIRDATKEDVWDAYTDVADPYVTRRDRLEVTERIDYNGDVLTPLDEDDVREAARVFEKRGIDTIAISLVNAYVNGDHERRVQEIVETEHPGAFVCCSHEILPEMFEHERTSTTIVNAALVPVVREYLTDLARQLSERGYDNDVLAMHSGGGVMTTDAIAYYAARIANSGPTAGAIAGQYIAEQCGFDNAIGFDMGGTSVDVSLTYGGDIEMTDEWAVEYGYPIMFPSTDIETIGAGGGSIAWIDEGGSLRVGPRSQGADPGPACYMRGGDKPTITDANVLLGWVDPDKFLGGEMDATAGPSRDVIEREIAEPLDLGVTEAASAIEQIAIANMCNAVRLVSTSKGYDPRDFAIVAFGGAGPMHAAHVAEEMNIPNVIVPPYPGINSALGCLLVDVEHDLSKTFVANATEEVADDLAETLEEVEAEILDRLRAEEIEDDEIRLDHEVKMRYAGQWRSLAVPCSLPIESVEAIRERFHEEHERVYAYSDRDATVEIYGIRVTGRGVVEKPSFPEIESGDLEDAHLGTREVYFESAGEFVETDLYQRERLGAGETFSGPAIVEQMDSTVVVPPAAEVEVEATGNLIIEI